MKATAVFGRTSALRRAQAVARCSKASILIDDQPANNAWEAALIRAFGTRVAQVRSTEEALAFLTREPVDVILSDIARDTSAQAGLEALPALAKAAPSSPVVFYVGAVRPELGTPIGAFGLTNRPDALLHLVLDVLERARM
jgi:CheY-like chemotaxis protein